MSGGSPWPGRAVLATGGDGQLGRVLASMGAAPGLRAVGRRGPDGLDLADTDSIVAALDRVRPDLVVNAAAYTDVDGAEADEETADAVNHLGAARLARVCADRGVDLVHVSTDYVFDGSVPGGGDPASAPGLEPGDPVGPTTAYGRTKLAGERAVLHEHPSATVVRTAWVYTGALRAAHGLGGSDFVATMIRLEAEREEIAVVDDQWGCPTYSRVLADELLQLAYGTLDGVRDARGRTLHLAGGGRTTWCGLARAVFRYLGADPERVRPCTTAEFPRPAPRPAFSVLSSDSWASTGLTPPPEWGDDLVPQLAELAWNRERGGR